MRKKIVAIMMTAILGASLFIGCSGVKQTSTPQKGGLQIVGMNTAVGGEGDSMDIQTVSYTISLFNGQEQAVRVDAAEPVLAAQVQERILSKKRSDVNISILPGQTKDIKGEVRFSGKGLTKEQITGWGALVTGIRLGNEQVLISQ